MKAKILNVKSGEIFARIANGTNYVKGDYINGPKLYEVKTTKGTYNLDRGEILNLAAELGITCVYITGKVLASLVGSMLDVSKIKDK